MLTRDGATRIRRLGMLVESIHAVVYFAPEPQFNYAALELRGYWRGYFASRAARPCDGSSAPSTRARPPPPQT